jgi:hypothetical protein
MHRPEGPLQVVVDRWIGIFRYSGHALPLLCLTGIAPDRKILAGTLA